MPLPPTFRVFFRDDLPVPPTMNYNSTFPVRGSTGAAAPRRTPAGPAEANNRRLASQKPFDNYKPEPAVSPYLLLNTPTANGTISPYMVLVRPAQSNSRPVCNSAGRQAAQAARRINPSLATRRPCRYGQ